MTVRQRVAEVLPVPFVGAVALLLALIVLTPNLLSATGPAAGSLESSALLLVDRIPGGNWTHLYVHGFGPVRYTTIAIEIAPGVHWPPPGSPSAFRYGPPSFQNDSLEVSASTFSNPFAVNVTAIYIDPSGVGIAYIGTFAFEASGDALLAVSYTTGASVDASTPIASLPLTVFLATSSIPSGVP